MKRDDIVIPRGSTVKKAWPIRTATGEPAVLTGFQARAKVRDPITKDVYATFSALEDGTGLVAGMYIDHNLSLVVMYIPASVSEPWTWKNGVYDIELFNGDTPPVVIRVVQGRIRLSKDVTYT